MVENKAGGIPEENRIRLDPGGFSDPFSGYGQQKTLCILQVYKQWGIRCVNLSPIDVAMGIEEFKANTAELNLEFVSANLINKQTGRALFPTHTIVSIAGKRFAIIGFSKDVVKQ